MDDVRTDLEQFHFHHKSGDDGFQHQYEIYEVDMSPLSGMVQGTIRQKILVLAVSNRPQCNPAGVPGQARLFSVTRHRCSKSHEQPGAPPVTATKPYETNDQRPQVSPAMVAAARFTQRIAGKTTETYTAYGVTQKLVKECAKQADYTIPQTNNEDAEMPKTEEGQDLGVAVTPSWWFAEAGLQPTYSTWTQVTMMHMYFLSVRIRCFSPDISAIWQQHLLDHFFYDAENRLTVLHNIESRGMRNRHLKDLFLQWRGLLAAYDEGLIKGDAVLAAAVWRNVFKGNENIDVASLAVVVSYMRRIFRGLEAVPDKQIVSGHITFGDPRDELALVDGVSPLMDLPFQNGNAINQPASSA